MNTYINSEGSIRFFEDYILFALLTKWRHQTPLKRRWKITADHNVISQKTVICITNTVNTSNQTTVFLFWLWWERNNVLERSRGLCLRKSCLSWPVQSPSWRLIVSRLVKKFSAFFVNQSLIMVLQSCLFCAFFRWLYSIYWTNHIHSTKYVYKYIKDVSATCFGTSVASAGST